MHYSTLLVRKIKNIINAIDRRLYEKRISGVDVGEQIRIYDLVCPLRYDILIRANFISLIAHSQDVSIDNLDYLLRYPAARAYETWLREIEVRRFFPEKYHEDNLFRKHLIKRIRNLKRLWESIQKRGFDYSSPIKLVSGEEILEVNGKVLQSSIFAGDGCHRTACLLVLGNDVLEPKEYEIRLRAKLQPLDNTSILLQKLPISMSEYLSFISRGYCNGQAVNSIEGVLAYVEKNKPDRIAELKSVLLHDMIYL